MSVEASRPMMTKILGIGLKDPGPSLAFDRTLLVTNRIQLVNHIVGQLKYWKPKASKQWIQNRKKISITRARDRYDHNYRQKRSNSRNNVEIKSRFGPIQVMLFWIKRSRTMVTVSWSSCSRQRMIPGAQKRSEILVKENSNSGLSLLKYGSINKNSTLWNTQCSSKQTNVPISDTTNSNRTDHIACQIWPTMLHISWALTSAGPSLTPETFQNPSRVTIITGFWDWLFIHEFDAHQKFPELLDGPHIWHHQHKRSQILCLIPENIIWWVTQNLSQIKGFDYHYTAEEHQRSILQKQGVQRTTTPLSP